MRSSIASGTIQKATMSSRRTAGSSSFSPVPTFRRSLQDPNKPTPEEAKAIAVGSIAYYGTYTVDEANKVISMKRVQHVREPIGNRSEANGDRHREGLLRGWRLPPAGISVSAPKSGSSIRCVCTVQGVAGVRTGAPRTTTYPTRHIGAAARTMTNMSDMFGPMDSRSLVG